MVQGASWTWYTDLTSNAATGPYWPKGARNKKKKGKVHFEAKVWSYMPFLGVLEKIAARKKDMHFKAKVWIFMSFGLLGEGCSIEKERAFQAKVWISMPFLGLPRWNLRTGKRVCILKRSVDFHTLFGLVGKVCGAAKGHAWSKSVRFLGFLGKAAAWKKGKQFEVSERR